MTERLLKNVEGLFREDLLETIVTEWNLYVQKKSTSDLTIEELKACSGILILIGLNLRPSMRLYFSTDINFHCS